MVCVSPDWLEQEQNTEGWIQWDRRVGQQDMGTEGSKGTWGSGICSWAHYRCSQVPFRLLENPGSHTVKRNWSQVNYFFSSVMKEFNPKSISLTTIITVLCAKSCHPAVRWILQLPHSNRILPPYTHTNKTILSSCFRDDLLPVRSSCLH